MAMSSAQFAKRVYEALSRIEPSVTRRTNGVSKGAGTHSNVVQYGTAAESPTQGVLYTGPDVTYVASGDDEGAFLVNRSGIYSISASAGSTAGATVAIKTGSAVDNTLADATQRAATLDGDSPSISSLSWTGFISAGDYIWIHNGGTVSAVVADNQITIARHP